MSETIEANRVLSWEDPPPSKNASHRSGRPPVSAWNRVAEELRGERGRWGVLYEGEKSTALNVRKSVAEGRLACFRPIGDFEACLRSSDGKHVLYARFLGDGEDL